MKRSTEQNFTENKRRIFILAIVMSLLLAGGSYIYFSFEKKAVQTEAQNRLKTIAELKVSQIEVWNKERISDAKAFSQGSFFIQGLKRWINNKSDSRLKKEIIKKFSLINVSSAYSNIFICNTSGTILLSLNPNYDILDSTTTRFVKEAIGNNRLLSTGFYRSKPNDTVYMDYIAPIIDNKKVIAVLILRVNPQNYIYPLLKKWPVPSKTSETLLVRKDGDSVLFLNEIRQMSNTALKLRIPLTRKDVPSVQAVMGRQGIFEGQDYEGKKVLAYLIKIPGTNWFMITKIQLSEINSDLYYNEIIIISFTIVLIIIMTLGLMLYYHYRQKNIYRELFIKEKELREYQEEFRTILYSIGDGVISTDLSGKIKQMNHTAEELTGWNESEAAGKPVEEIFKIINEETRTPVANPIHKVLKEGAITGLANHTLLISKSGVEIPVADSAAPIRDEKGEIEGVVLVFRNKAEEHEAEKIIQQSETRLRRAELTSKSGNWELHLDSQIMIASEGAAKIYGVDWREMSMEVIKKFPLPEYRPIMDAALKNLIEKNEPYDIEFKIKTADTGEIKDIHSISHYDKKNKIVFGVIQDISEKKKAEAEIFSSEERMRAIVEGTPYLFFYTQDTEANITYISPSIEKITGYTVKQWLGQKHWFATNSPINKIAKEKTYIHLQGEFTREPIFLEILDINQNHILLEIYENPIIKNNKVVGLQGVAHDITEQKKLENERFQLLNILQNSLNEIYVFNSEKLNFEYVNKGALQNLGYTLEEIIKLTPVDIKPEFTEEKLKQTIKPLLTGERDTLIFETFHKRKNGSFYPVEIHLQLHKIDNRSVFLAIINDITERKKSEEALKEREAFLNNLIETIPIPVFYKDINLRYISANDAFVSLFGYTKEQINGKSVTDLYNPELSKIYIKKDKELLESGGKQIYESKFSDTKGTEHDVIFYKARYSDNQNNIGGLIGAILDISEHKKFEEALRQSEERLRLSTELANVAVWEYDFNTDSMSRSKNHDSLYGLEWQDKWNINVFLKSTHPDDREFSNSTIQKSAAPGGPDNYKFDFRVIYPDKTIHWLMVIGQVVERDGNGYGKKVRGSLIDITDRKKAEEEVQKTEQIMRLFVEHAPAAIAMFDTEMRYLAASKRFLTDYGLDDHDIIGKSHYDIFPEVPDRWKEIHKRCLSGSTESSDDDMFPRADGRVDWVRWEIRPWYETKGNIGGIILFSEMITERKHAEEDIQKSKERWESLFNNSPAAIAVYKPVDGGNDFVFTDFNLTAQKVENISHDEVIGNKISELFPSAEKSGFLEAFRKVWNTGITEHLNSYYQDERIEGWRENIIYKLNTGEIVAIYNDITARMKAEIALRESEERFRTVFNASPGAISISEVSTGMLFEVNDAYKKVFGFTNEEVKGRTSIEIGIWLNELDRKTIIEEIKRNGAYDNIEIKFRKKDGTIINTIVSGRIITINNKKLMLTLINDITALYTIGQALKESEERLKITLYSIGDGVITTDKYGRVNRMNPVAEALTGWKETDSKDKPLEEVFNIISEDTRKPVENPVVKVVREGKIIGLANHTLLLSKDGKEIPIADSGAPIRDENGEIDGVVLVFRDQLKEREAQKILEESEAQLRQSQKVARIGYYNFNIKTGTWTNSEMLDEIFGIDKNYTHSIEGWLNLIHPEYRQEMEDYLTNYIITGKNEFNKEYKILRKIDNTELWVRGVGNLEIDNNGIPVKMFGTIQDITAWKEAQNIIIKSLKEKEIMLKEIHHRVKNNFQMIIGLITLQADLVEDKEVLSVFDDLQARLRSMSIIHELMYSTEDFIGVDIKDYISRLSDSLIRTYSSSGRVRLNLDLENHNLNLDSIIPCGLIINEVLTNSLKYAFPGETGGIISITFKKINGIFNMIYSDNGIGINEKIDFDSIKSLGLRLVHLFTEQLKGTLEVIRPEKGLQFMIKFKE